MTNQPDFLELLFGDKVGTVSDAGELNVYVPTPRELDQQLDMEDLLDNSDLTFAPGFIQDAYLADDTCVPCEEVVEEVIMANNELPQETPSTSDYEQQQLVFQFPPYLETESFQTLLLESEPEANVPQISPSSPFSPTSSYSSYADSLPPPTPDTASSMDSVSSHIPTFLKHGLKSAILEKRKREGKGAIQVEFRPPEPEKLTAEEELKRVEKRERNKLAAQKCRSKKRERGDVLEAETKKLAREQSKFRTEIEKLKEERDHLMDILNVHGSVCPKLRALIRMS